MASEATICTAIPVMNPTVITFMVTRRMRSVPPTAR
jgi:hypothetical protein